MSDKIVAALKSLDVNNDQHWTTDGAPRIDTLKILVGNPGLSREDVNAALPGFSRATAASFGTTGESGVPPVVIDPVAQSAAGTAPQEPAAPVTPPADQAAPEQAGSLDDLPNLNEEPLSKEGDEARAPRGKLMLPDVNQMDLAEVHEYLSELVTARHEINQAIPLAQNRIAFLDGQAAKDAEAANQNPIQAYLASQVRKSEERAALRQTVEESGVNLKDLAKRIGPAPIDAALQNRPRTPRKPQ